MIRFDLRGLLLLILMLGLAGTGAELVLLQHYQDWWQVTPLALIGLAVGVVLWHAFAPGPGNLRTMAGLMVVFVASGLIGIGLHYNANAEFESEMDPSLAGLRLFAESMSGATPTLAPGTMVQLGLIGLAYTYRHPRWIAARRQP